MQRLKFISIALLVLFCLLILLPAVIVKGCQRGKLPDIDEETTQVAVWHHRTQELVNMNLGEYLLGVVAAEMPAQFDIEALKAQAIVARTYTVRQMRAHGGAGCSQHPQADVCTDHTHCQAWVSRQDAQANWPFFQQNSYWGKIQAAVSDTRQQVITHQQKLIDAVYHSTCGGSTENAEDVWTNTIPYLRAVPCNFCAHSPRMTETVSLSTAEVAKKLDQSVEDLRLDVLKRAASGRIVEIDVGAETLRGLDFRARLGLRSSLVTWLQQQGDYTFTTTGYGHAVGLCQYGADGMATQGYSYQDILSHYYTEVEISRVKTQE